ncbi:MAG: helix-turn-helix domain-containing protein [Pseudomonadota bacterium]|nr:helix-turn-helix domain-containing protein [Pseudomonadota bacterium]
MTDPDPGDEATLFPKTAGERLREAREAQGLSLAEIAARTRVPRRQLEAIENSDYAKIPSATYAVGFARAYARAVGADEVAIAREVRGVNDRAVHRTEYEAYEISEPARVPTRGVALFGLAIAVVVLIGIGVWYGTGWFRGDERGAPSPVSQTVPAAVPDGVSARPATGGQVRLTATYG